MTLKYKYKDSKGRTRGFSASQHIYALQFFKEEGITNWWAHNEAAKTKLRKIATPPDLKSEIPLVQALLPKSMQAAVVSVEEKIGLKKARTTHLLPKATLDKLNKQDIEKSKKNTTIIMVVLGTVGLCILLKVVKK